MPQNELLSDVLRRDVGFLQMTVSDMSDGELAQRPVPGANTALWQLGHLITADAHMVNACAGRTVVELPAGF
ncbi:MAG TPA: DinB family protein, partial [Tepidisphaeraceae bacterium]|nr:DinB family protein [Tepidisphaeraceae bacterium]